MESYRTEKQAAAQLALADEDGEIDPVQAERGGGRQEPLLEPLSLILDEFNKTWGNSFTDPEQVGNLIKGMPERVNGVEAYRNAKMYSDRENARIEHNSALRGQITAMLRCNTEFYKKYTEDHDFRQWLNRQIFSLTYQRDPAD